MRDIGRLRKNRRKVRALSADDLHDVRAAIRLWQRPVPGKPGPRRTQDLADIVDVLLATGCRIGELLALRWVDLDLSSNPPTATISGTLVYVRGRGLFRQAWTKSDAGYRRISLPQFAVETVLVRHTDTGGSPEDPVFPSRKGTWLSPHNVRRQWREARKDTGLDWVTPHVFRKTVATIVDNEVNAKAAAAQLGHASEEITTTYYIQKAHDAPDLSNVLDVALRPTRGTDGSAA